VTSRRTTAGTGRATAGTGRPTAGTGVVPTVLIDARYLRRPGVGIAVVVAALIDELEATGALLVLVTDDEAAGAQLRLRYPRAAVRVVKPAPWLWWEQVRLARLVWQLKPDLYVAPANCGVPLIHPRRTRTLLVVHDLIPVIFWRRYLMPRARWAVMYLLATACAVLAADKIVTVSDATASDLRRLTGRRATVIHPPIPDRRARPRPRPRPAPGPLPGSLPGSALRRPYVLFNGGLDERKNLPVLLEAFASFSGSPEGASFDLVVMGGGTEHLKPRLHQLGIADRTRLIGLVPERWKWTWIERASCIAYPSSYEGFGLVVVEGFAAGVPVVTGTAGSLREVGASAVVTVDPTSAVSVAEGLRSATEPRRAAALVEAGYEQLERLRSRSGGYDRFVVVPAGCSRSGAASSDRVQVLSEGFEQAQSEQAVTR